VDAQFEAWCEQRWTVWEDWARVPCAVHVSPACEHQARSAYPHGGVDFIGIAAHYYGELTSKFWTGQMLYPLAEPLQGEWYVLLYLGMIYIDARPHPLATQERQVSEESV
jgi:hypothetical protein